MGHAISSATRTVQLHRRTVESSGTSGRNLLVIPAETPSSDDGRLASKAEGRATEGTDGGSNINGISLTQISKAAAESNATIAGKKKSDTTKGSAGECHGHKHPPCGTENPYPPLVLAAAAAAASAGAAFLGHGHLYPSSAPHHKAATSLVAAASALYLVPQNKTVAEAEDISARHNDESDNQRLAGEDPSHDRPHNAVPEESPDISGQETDRANSR
ncbi:hypothetical protein ACP4OV_030796 [Aristida adscensionis]